MKKTIYKYNCDLCGKEHEENEISIVTIPVMSFTPSIGTFYNDNQVYYKKKEVMICGNCLKKITVVHDDGTHLKMIRKKE